MHPQSSHPLLILIAGPYRSGANENPERIAANVRQMTDTALRVIRAGHLPVMSEWSALPLIEHAGSVRVRAEIFIEIFHPLARQAGRLVFTSLDHLPPVEPTAH